VNQKLLGFFRHRSILQKIFTVLVLSVVTFFVYGVLSEKDANVVMALVLVFICFLFFI